MKHSFYTILSKLLRLILITAVFTATLPANARFLQEDPMGFEAGDLNVYRYVGNNPVSRTDPSGMEALDYGLINAVAATALLVGVIAVKSDFLNGQTTSHYIRQTTNNSLSAIAGWWNCGAFAQGEFLGVAGEYEDVTIDVDRCGATAMSRPSPIIDNPRARDLCNERLNQCNMTKMAGSKKWPSWEGQSRCTACYDLCIGAGGVWPMTLADGRSCRFWKLRSDY